MAFFIALILTLALSLHAAQAQPADKPMLRLVANYWEPYTGPKAPAQGIATGIVVTALRHAGYPVQVQFVPWSRVLMMVYLGHADGVVGIWPTTQRSAKLHYSDSYLINELSFFTTVPGNSNCRFQDSGRPPRIGVGRDYDYSDSFLEQYGAALIPGDRLVYNLLKLKAGRLDLLLEDKYILRFALTEYAPTLGPMQIHPCPHAPQLRLPLHFAVSARFPHAQAVVADFNRELRKMKKNGELQGMLKPLAANWGAPAGQRVP